MHLDELDEPDDLSGCSDEDLWIIIQMLEEALNNSDSSLLRSVVNSFFLNNCSILSKSRNRMLGRQLIHQHYQSFLDKFSDCCFQLVVKVKQHRLLVIEKSCVGTIQPITSEFQENMYALWNSFDIFDFDYSECSRSTTLQKFYDIMFMNVNPVTFDYKVDMTLIMSEDIKPVVIHVMWDVVSLDFYEQEI